MCSQGYNELYCMIKGSIRENEVFGIVSFTGRITRVMHNNWTRICNALSQAFFDHHLTFSSDACMYHQKKHNVPVRVIYMPSRDQLPCVQLCNAIVSNDLVATSREFVKIYTKNNSSPPKIHTQFAGISPELPLWEIYTYICNRASASAGTSDALIIWHRYPNMAQLMYTHPFTLNSINLFAELCKTRRDTPEERWSHALKCTHDKDLQKIVQISKLYAIPTKYAGTDIYPDSPNGDFLGVALQQALYEMLYASSIDEGAKRIISRGGFIELNTLVYLLLCNEF